MKHKLLCFSIIILACGSACSKQQVNGILDDISRDTYENNAREQRIEKLGDPAYEEPLTYDQYQRERKELIQEKSPSEAGNIK